MKVGIIGAGNMGGAIFRALVADGFKVAVYDHHFEKAVSLGKKNAFRSLTKLVENADCIIIAVKPQSFKKLAVELKGQVASKFVISIMAGITLKRVTSLTAAEHVVRSMPNLPCRVGEGVTGWVASKQVTTAEKKLVRNIFSATGIEIELHSESMIDKLSTVSGCGPAYFFYLTEILESQLRSFGFSSADAERISKATCVGAARLLAMGDMNAKVWRQAVSSKKGITLEAINELQRKKLPAIFASAIKKGLERTREIAKSL